VYKLGWRYSQVVRQGIANPSPPVQIWVPPNLILYLLALFYFRGCGGMVDTTDLKSVDFTVVRVQVPPPPLYLELI
jgi:hypothetical protein